jgi:hypothetical protein
MRFMCRNGITVLIKRISILKIFPLNPRKVIPNENR